MRILYLEGFSSGPGLPYPLLHHPDYTVIHAYMPYYWIDILCNPYFLLGLSIFFFMMSTILNLISNLRYQSIKSSGYSALLILGSIYLFYYIKMLGFRWTIDTCIKSIQNEIKIHQPDVIIGYSWGGGIASFMIERNLWIGHTILLAPAAHLLAQHASLPPPNLNLFSSQQSKYLYIIQGTHDGVTSYQDNLKLYEDASGITPSLFSSSNKEIQDQRFIQFYKANGHDHSLSGFVNKEFLRKLFINMRLIDN